MKRTSLCMKSCRTRALMIRWDLNTVLGLLEKRRYHASHTVGSWLSPIINQTTVRQRTQKDFIPFFAGFVDRESFFPKILDRIFHQKLWWCHPMCVWYASTARNKTCSWIRLFLESTCYDRQWLFSQAFPWSIGEKVSILQTNPFPFITVATPTHSKAIPFPSR